MPVTLEHAEMVLAARRAALAAAPPPVSAQQFHLVLVPVRDPLGRDVHRRLAMALKALLRGHCFRCISAREVGPTSPQISEATATGTRCGTTEKSPA